MTMKITLRSSEKLSTRFQIEQKESSLSQCCWRLWAPLTLLCSVFCFTDLFSRYFDEKFFRFGQLSSLASITWIYLFSLLFGSVNFGLSSKAVYGPWSNPASGTASFPADLIPFHLLCTTIDITCPSVTGAIYSSLAKGLFIILPTICMPSLYSVLTQRHWLATAWYSFSLSCLRSLKILWLSSEHLTLTSSFSPPDFRQVQRRPL